MVLCAGAFGCYAAQGSLPGAQGQGYDLNLSYSRTTLKAVADAITQQVGIAFSYETALAGYPMENLEVSEKGATIEAILAAVFTPRGIDYRVVDKVVVLTRSTRPVPAASAAAKSEVKGVVRDAAGNPMIGVTVTIKGTLVGVSTGVDGGYAIPADGNATLLFSYIGYRPHEEVVGRRTQIDVTMQEDELVMDEVVVVGYGTLKKRNIVGAVENLSGDAVENRPNANITRSLQGQIPGLNIVQVDGKADHAGEVTIRGVNNTFKARVSGGEKTNKLGQGGGALVLIDGAEGDMGSVNPDDIASISVLKDASSAAVYGARGAFGVILITTKDPEKGKVRVSYNGSVSLHRRTVIWEDNVVTDPVQWVDAFRESYLNSSPTATVPSLFNNYMPYSNAWFEELKRRRADPTMDNYDIDANGNYNYYGETNWLKEIYKSVNYSTTHAVSIQGGREGVSYYISGRYYNQDGIYKVGEETYKKYNLRAKGSIRIRPWLTLDNNTSLMSSKYHQPMVHYGQQVISRQIDMFAFPFALLKNPDGTWTQTAAKTGYAAFAEGTSWQENNKLEVANTTTFNFEFVPDVFKVSADVTYKGSRWSRDRMENLYTYYTGVNVSGQDNSYSSLENWTYRSDYISTNIVGTVTPKLGADHDLNVVAGWNLEDYDYRTQKTYRQGNLYPSKPSFTLMDGEYYSTTSGGYTWGLVGFFGRVNYAYAGRYLAEVSARYDGSSKFPSSSQWGFFPSASVGWRLSEEPWLKPHVEGWLDNFKVRASIGSLGNANIDPYQYLETMTASGSASIAKSSVIINGQNVPYTSVPSLIPDDITWEKVTTYNIGLDLDLFHNRLSFTGDYYRRNTTDLYTVGPNLPQVLGSAAPYGNYASLKTKGWELSLSWRDSFNLGGKPFSYSIKGMLWDSRSWITDYYNETGDLTTYYKGMEIGEIWGFRTAGIYASNADALNGPAYNFFKNGEMFRAYAGDLRFVDVDGDGIMTKGNGLWGPGTHNTLNGVDQSQVRTSTMSSVNEYADWTALYTTVNQANLVIRHVPAMGLKEKPRAFCLGNAHFIRAYCFFQIARIWGDAPLPLWGYESTDTELFLGRTPVSEVLMRVERDIADAERYVADTSDKTVATPAAVAMLKADYALWMYRMQAGGEAYLAMAQEALGELGLSDALLEPAYADIFSSSNKCGREVIFAVHQDVSEALNGPAYYLGWNESYVEAAYRNNPVPTTGGNQWWWYTDTYRALLQADPADTRAALTCRTADYGTGGRRIGWTEKLMGRVDNGTRIFDSDFILYRYGEAFLMAAEARYYGKDYAGALEALAPLAARAYGRRDYYTDTSPEAVLQAIVDEYLREMVGEGRTWWMLLRTDKIWEYSADIAAQRDKNPNILLWPITQAAMSRNYNLTQTEGWY